MKTTENGNGHMTGMIVGTLLGAVAGAGLALLYAPRSGKETRQLLSQRAQRVKEKARAAFEHGKETVRHEMEELAATGDLASFGKGPVAPRTRG